MLYYRCRCAAPSVDEWANESPAQQLGSFGVINRTSLTRGKQSICQLTDCPTDRPTDVNRVRRDEVGAIKRRQIGSTADWDRAKRKHEVRGVYTNGSSVLDREMEGDEREA